MNTDEAVAALWEVCDDEWSFRATADQWWVVTARCPHGSWQASSRGALDLHTAFTTVLEAATAAHASS